MVVPNWIVADRDCPVFLLGKEAKALPKLNGLPKPTVRVPAQAWGAMLWVLFEVGFWSTTASSDLVQLAAAGRVSSDQGSLLLSGEV